MKNDPTIKHIEAIHDELDAYQRKHKDTSWILTVCKDGIGATVSIGGTLKDTLMLIVNVLVHLVEDEDNPLRVTERILETLEDTLPDAVETKLKLNEAAEDDESVRDALKSLAKALKHGHGLDD